MRGELIYIANIFTRWENKDSSGKAIKIPFGLLFIKTIELNILESSNRTFSALVKEKTQFLTFIVSEKKKIRRENGKNAVTVFAR